MAGRGVPPHPLIAPEQEPGKVEQQGHDDGQDHRHHLTGTGDQLGALGLQGFGPVLDTLHPLLLLLDQFVLLALQGKRRFLMGKLAALVVADFFEEGHERSGVLGSHEVFQRLARSPARFSLKLHTMMRYPLLLLTLACSLVEAGTSAPLVAVDVGHTRAAPDAELFISIHHDSVNESELETWEWEGQRQTYSDRWRGYSLFVSRRNPYPEASLLCASTMGARLQREGFVPTDKNARRHPWADQAETVHWYDNLMVLHQARQPAVLFEAGVIKNRDEELELANPARQARMAEALASGIAACLQVLRWEATLGAATGTPQP